jgi:hypothetical protein
MELVHATNEQDSPCAQPAVTGGLPRTVQRWPTACAAESSGSSFAAEQPSAETKTPQASALQPSAVNLRLIVFLVFIG